MARQEGDAAERWRGAVDVAGRVPLQPAGLVVGEEVAWEMALAVAREPDGAVVGGVGATQVEVAVAVPVGGPEGVTVAALDQVSVKRTGPLAFGPLLPSAGLFYFSQS